MEAGKQVANQIDPALQEQLEGNAVQVKEWFTKHPNEEDATALTMQEKKDFILMYYSEDLNSDDLIEKMLEEAEKTLDSEIQKGHTKLPFTPELIYSTITICKAKIMDELVEEVDKFYTERRKLIKGKEINDPGVIKITQLNCSKMAMSLQNKILQQVEEEAKSRSFPMEEFMGQCVMVAMSDVQSFVEIERIYNFRKADEKKDQEFKKDDVKKYIEESLVIAQMITDGKIESSLVFVYPHLLSDKLYNVTGYESEQIVNLIRRAIKDDKIDEELVNMIIKEAYAVEKSRENCQSNFDTQMMDYETQMMAAMQERQEQLKNLKDPMDDPAIKRMIEMGMLNKDQAEEMIRAGGMPPGMGGMPAGMGGMPAGMGGMPPGMEAMMGGMGGFPPGMGGMPPGMEALMGGMGGFPPGMGGMPPGMEALMGGMGGMPPGMEGMFPPGMMPSPEMLMQMLGPDMFGPDMFGPGGPGAGNPGKKPKGK